MGKWIDTDAAYAVLTDYYHHSTETQHAALREALGRVESVDAVPVRRGKWKHKKDLKQFFCDQCGEPSLTEDDVYFYDMEFPNFCPNCGAKMDWKDGDRT